VSKQRFDSLANEGVNTGWLDQQQLTPHLLRNACKTNFSLDNYLSGLTKKWWTKNSNIMIFSVWYQHLFIKMLECSTKLIQYITKYIETIFIYLDIHLEFRHFCISIFKQVKLMKLSLRFYFLKHIFNFPGKFSKLYFVFLFWSPCSLKCKIFASPKFFSHFFFTFFAGKNHSYVHLCAAFQFEIFFLSFRY
jgi:hypothetical protein